MVNQRLPLAERMPRAENRILRVHFAGPFAASRSGTWRRDRLPQKQGVGQAQTSYLRACGEVREQIVVRIVDVARSKRQGVSDSSS